MNRIPRTTAIERLHKKRQQEVIDLKHEVESLKIKLDNATKSNASYINERNTFYVETFKKMGLYDTYIKKGFLIYTVGNCSHLYKGINYA